MAITIDPANEKDGIPSEIRTQFVWCDTELDLGWKASRGLRTWNNHILIRKSLPFVSGLTQLRRTKPCQKSVSEAILEHDAIPIWRKGGLVRDFEDFNFLRFKLPRKREKRVPGQSAVVSATAAKEISEFNSAKQSPKHINRNKFVTVVIERIKRVPDICPSSAVNRVSDIGNGKPPHAV
jgi:hypothetical protein